jgi:cytochrome c553
MPAIVAHGSLPQEKSGTALLPCALCHLPNGSGHVESASLAGLSASGASKFLTALKARYAYSPPLAGRPPTYLVRQLLNLKSGDRRGSLAAPMQAVASTLGIDESVHYVSRRHIEPGLP